MRYVIDSNVLGSEKHLYVNEGSLRWIDAIPNGIWYFDGTLKEDEWCLDTLLELNHRCVDTAPDSRYSNVMSTLTTGSIDPTPWSMLMAPHHYKEHVKKIVMQVEESIKGVDEHYFRSTWVPETAIFNRLVPARVDENAWRVWMAKEVGNRPIIKTFRPDADGFANKITYNRFGTRTGRLTVSSGPNILTLRKDARGILKSRYDSGAIMMYDFSALEVRIVLYEAGLRCMELDLYEFINKEVFNGSVDRAAIKQAIISDLYGQHKMNLGKRLGISGNALDSFVKKIRTFLQFERLQKRVKNAYVKRLHVVNRYGRQIAIDEPLDNIIFNSYVQSTGVDVTLLGFNELCTRHLPNDCEPLFLLHDALLIDVKDPALLPPVVWVKVPGYVQKWPLKLEHVDVQGVSSEQEVPENGEGTN